MKLTGKGAVTNHYSSAVDSAMRRQAADTWTPAILESDKASMSQAQQTNVNNLTLSLSLAAELSLLWCDKSQRGRDGGLISRVDGNLPHTPKKHPHTARISWNLKTPAVWMESTHTFNTTIIWPSRQILRSEPESFHTGSYSLEENLKNFKLCLRPFFSTGGFHLVSPFFICSERWHLHGKV